MPEEEEKLVEVWKIQMFTHKTLGGEKVKMWYILKLNGHLLLTEQWQMWYQSVLYQSSVSWNSKTPRAQLFKLKNVLKFKSPTLETKKKDCWFKELDALNVL